MRTLVKIMLIAILGMMILSFPSSCESDNPKLPPPESATIKADTMHKDTTESIMVTELAAEPRVQFAQFYSGGVNESGHQLTKGQQHTNVGIGSLIFDGSVIVSLLGLLALTIKSDKDSIKELAKSNDRIADLMDKQESHNRRIEDLQNKIADNQSELMVMIKGLSEK